MTEARKVGGSTKAAGNRGKGRPKGVPNKVNAALKDMILNALNKAGGEQYLTRQSEENPVAFLTLVGKVLPLQVSGEGGGPVGVVVFKGLNGND